MAYQHTVNLTPTGGFAQVIGTFCNLLQSAGWSVFKWSNGTTVSTGSTTFTSTTLDASGAWVVLSQPTGGTAPFSGSRQLLFWRRSTDRSWHINYSASGAYTAGTGTTATTPPSASDEVSTYGGESQAARSSPYDLIQSPYDPNSINTTFQLAASDTAPFVCWMVGYTKGQGSNSANTMKMFWMMEGIQSSSFPLNSGDLTAYTTDKEPYVFLSNTYQGSQNIFAGSWGGLLSTNYLGYKSYGQPGQVWKNVGRLYERPGNGSNFNHITSKVDLVPVFFGGSSLLKGLSATIRFTSKELNGLTLLDGDATNDYIVYADCALPWDVANTPTA